MKKRIAALLFLFIIFFSTKTLAIEIPGVQATVNGKVEKGSNIQIIINVSDVKSFYAGAFEFKYDNSILKIKSIEPGDLISNKDIEKFEAIKKIDEQNGIASYGFTCLGKINGYSGAGKFAIIDAEVLKAEDFYINSKPFLNKPDKEYNLKLQLCDSNIKELNYKYTPYDPIGTFQNNKESIKNITNSSDNVNNGKNTNKIELNNTPVDNNNGKNNSTEISQSNSVQKKEETNTNASVSEVRSSAPELKGSKNNEIIASGKQNAKRDSNKFYVLIVVALGVITAATVSLNFLLKKKRKAGLEKESM